MKMSEPGFWLSPLKKVLKMIDMYQDEENLKLGAYNNTDYQSKYFTPEPEEIHSMKELEGFV